MRNDPSVSSVESVATTPNTKSVATAIDDFLGEENPALDDTLGNCMLLAASQK